MRTKVGVLLAALVTAAGLALVGCSGSPAGDLVGDNATPTISPARCTPAFGASRQLQLEMPEAGGYYTRHVPVEGWTELPLGQFVDIRVTGASGGLLGVTEIEVSDGVRNGRQRIEGVIVLQIIPEKVLACLVAGIPGSVVQVPIVVGGANP